MVKWIFVAGGVLSGLGKGVLSSSIAKLLESRGYKVVPIKCDGYLNVDPGTMNPNEHGEVYVLKDGGEVDMDFAHYENFLEVNGNFDWNLTSGKVFKEIIEREREGEFLGNTVQFVPHVTDNIIQRFKDIAEGEDADVSVVEIGGTVGDMENMHFLEAVRQMRQDKGVDSVLVHLTLVPYLETTGEQKTKPTQHAVKKLEETGLEPDMIVGRSEEELRDQTKDKIAMYTPVDREAVISDPNIDDLYKLPLQLEEEKVDEIILDRLGLPKNEKDMGRWRQLVENRENPEKEVEIALAGKYTEMEDTYFSIEQALYHAGAQFKAEVDIDIVNTEELGSFEDCREEFKDYDGVVVPGGFGARGTEGMIKTAEYCRKKGKPYLGICFGMQMMLVEYARNACGLEEAHSTEIDENTPHPVIDILPEQEGVEKKGGTMRLGRYVADLKDDTQVKELYGKDKAKERHRHRYEVNPDYHEDIRENGMTIAGTSENGRLVEYLELEDHSFFIGTQAHPEFTSRFEEPNPLYHGFMGASIGD
ncbi:MAG: CTP synthase [Candidatus Nanohaloarchaeota archaeon QJJ-9]|nr:CTP synthase [Candidatus Nanohaloarchaeota archaeon QJJ-9]